MAISGGKMNFDLPSYVLGLLTVPIAVQIIYRLMNWIEGIKSRGGKIR